MSEDLLSYYNRELLYLRRMGAEFANLHPKVAGRLRISGDDVEDPHVQRLFEGVAFLNARLRQKLDDEFPELAEGLLGQLYPHYLAPVPSMAIARFQPSPDLAKAYPIPTGTELTSEAVGDEPCRFRTTQPVELLPVDVDKATLSGRPLIGPISPPGCVGVLRLTLSCTNKDLTFAKLAPNSLRFYLRGAQAEALQLYELILNDAVTVAIADAIDDPDPLVLEATAIRPVGFDAGEGMLPYPARSPLGYRLLTEYFAFPEKFLFFEVTGLEPKLRRSGGKTLELFIYIGRQSSSLERSTSKDSFALGCTPMVNLFKHRAEPIRLTGMTSEYRVTPDSRRPGALEIYSIDAVSVASPSGDVVALNPVFGLKHAGSAPREMRFWHSARRATPDGGSEMFLSFVDLDGDPRAPADWVASVETTCSNIDLPSKLPFGGGRPYLQLGRERTEVAAITCLTPPTAQLRLPNRREGVWRLLSHLNLNHLSLADSGAGAEALREVLYLYDFRDAAETRAMIDSLIDVRSSRGTARAPRSGLGVLCHGLDISLLFDEQTTSGTGVFLLAAVLERFIAHFASINTFTRLTASIKGRSGVLRTWPPRAGDLTLL